MKQFSSDLEPLAIEIEGLNFDKSNAQKHDRQSIQAIKNSLSKFGQQKPIVVQTGSNKVIAGNGTLEAAIELGWKHIAVSWFDGDDIEAKAYAIADNRSAQHAEWHTENLMQAMLEISDRFDPEDVGFFEDELADIAEGRVDEAKGENNDEVVQAQKEVFSKVGEVYQLGQHRLVCGDNTNDEIMSSLMGDDVADIVVTDPPYNFASDVDMRKDRPDGGQLNKLAEADWDKDFDPTNSIRTMSDHLSENGSIYVFTSGFLFGKTFELVQEMFRDAWWMVWCKPNPAPSMHKRRWTSSTELIVYGVRGKWTFNFPADGHAYSHIIENGISAERNDRHDHPTQKPAKVITHLLTHSSKKGDIVLDGFGGSGTTMIAGAMLGRRCRMAELSPTYCDVIRRRWTKWATENSQEIGSGGLDP